MPKKSEDTKEEKVEEKKSPAKKTTTKKATTKTEKATAKKAPAKKTTTKKTTSKTAKTTAKKATKTTARKKSEILEEPAKETSVKEIPEEPKKDANAKEISEEPKKEANAKEILEEPLKQANIKETSENVSHESASTNGAEEKITIPSESTAVVAENQEAKNDIEVVHHHIRKERRILPRHDNRHIEVTPSLTREQISEMDAKTLIEKAAELGINARDFGEKDDLVNEVYEKLLSSEGFVAVKGILDVIKGSYGFIRTNTYRVSEHDVYVSPKLIKRNGLRKGDAIEGRVRPARGEDEKYPTLTEIHKLNGVKFEGPKQREKFENLTPIYPDERLILEHGANTITARVIDLVAPIGKGQRGLIVSPPKAGKTTVLKDIAAAIAANNPEVHLMCLLVDERPEEVTDMQRSIKGEVISSTFDMPCETHIQVAELVIERAKRLVETGRDVVILLDSITRLARAYNLGQPASGRVLSGGVDSTALYPPKKFLGAARNIEHGGSLTILGTALIDTGSKMDEVIFEEFKGTGNMELKLDRDLADRRIFPAINPITSGTRKEELLLDAQYAPLIWGVRRLLAKTDSTEKSMEMLIKSLQITETNTEFLARSARKASKKQHDIFEG